MDIVSNIAEIIGYAALVLHALIAVFMLIPGDEPEATLRKILSWIESNSRKP